MKTEGGSETDNGKSSVDSQKFSTEFMDTSVDPHTDFYSYSVGNWASRHPVPSDKSHWGTFEELMETNTRFLGSILERCSAGETPADPAVSRMLGDFYSSAMDTGTLEKLRFKPVEREMELIDRAETKDELNSIMVRMHLEGSYPFFVSFARADRKNSSVYAFYLYQGGLSLPNRDYYLEDSFADIRQFFVDHIGKVFRLYGMPEETASSYSGKIMSLETQLAKFSRSQTELRDAEKNYNSMPLKGLNQEFPGLHLEDYIRELKIPETRNVVMGQPEFFKALSSLVSETSLDDLKVYLKWKVLNSAASLLFSEIEEEHFDMFSRKIRGQQQQEPRWKRSVHLTDQCLGEALGKIYVSEHFGKEAREKMENMVNDIRDVFKDRLLQLPWMTSETKEHAMEKFQRFRAKIGHPDRFRDYSSVAIRKDDLLGNVTRAVAFEIRRELDRVGSPVDRDEWFMTPPTINAYFSPPDNEIVFPAGILQPPFFDTDADDAVNYGAIGAVISHEITHGYDDQGRRYDENGNLRDWWTQMDSENFLERAKAVVELYSNLEVLPGLNVNGELTLGENIADFGGISIAYEALQRHLEKNPADRKEIDGLTPEQRFYISWAQIWKENILEQEARMRVSIDPHAPNKIRAVIPVYNHHAFETAFPGSKAPAVDEKNNGKISIW